MNEKKRYEVHVTETHFFWGSVEVEARSQQEAQEIAAEEFQVDWSDSDLLDWGTQILTEEGVPVSWSTEAFKGDPRNPYVKETESGIREDSPKEVQK